MQLSKKNKIKSIFFLTKNFIFLIFFGYGLWSMVYGLWSMVYGLWSTVNGVVRDVALPVVQLEVKHIVVVI